VCIDEQCWIENSAAALTRLSRALGVAEPDEIAVQVTHAAARLVPARPEAAMCLLDRRGMLRPAAATGVSMATCHGPHLLGDEQCAPSRHSDLSTTAPGSVLAVPITTGAAVLGVLTLTARLPQAFSVSDVAVSEYLAQQAATALTHAAARKLNLELTSALESRTRIGMALGIIMTKGPLSPDHAFQFLRRYSQDNNRKLRDVADQIVETGQFPPTTSDDREHRPKRRSRTSEV
jgi:hypothetical protein